MKLSNITLREIKDFCGVVDNDSDKILLVISAAAKSYISNYTGLTVEELDGHDDFGIAYMILVNESFQNRIVSASDIKGSELVIRILDMHSRNLL